jgi:hypothetical protein
MAAGLARALLSGAWEPDSLLERGKGALGRKWRWLKPLVSRVLVAFPDGKPRRAARLSDFLRRDPKFQRASRDPKVRLEISIKASACPPLMSPAAGPPIGWTVPAITTPEALAQWLNLDLGRLHWLADCQGRERRARNEPLLHYCYRWTPKASGSLRLIESPKPRLKAIQRRLLIEILEAIPAHDAAHGFRRGRAVGTFVAPHAGRQVVLKMDLRDFFTSITAPRILAVFQTAGYPEEVARLLAGLCTNSVPMAVAREMERRLPAGSPSAWRSRRMLAQPHLPQGAPTSPALANLCSYKLDSRLQGLASAGGACYTRYADDLIFSGDEVFCRSINRFPLHVAAIALDEGFVVQHQKTRIMRRSVRQQAAGVVLNQHPNVVRRQYDELKATLHNCSVHGPVGQNRAGHPDFRAHLLGRIAHIAAINPQKATRLRAIFDRIDW